MDNQRKDKIHVYIAFFSPVFIAAFIRFWDLDLRPFHADEGVNGYFLLNLFKHNSYHYDPANYHGPFLYYIGLIPFYILGISDFSFRFMPVLFGIMVIALIYPLRRRIGAWGLLTAGLLIAVSPANSFFSRDTIHETYLIFFTLATVVSFFLYSETRKARYIYFAASSLAFVITIKETYIITFSIFALSLALAYGYEIVFFSKGTRLQTFKNILINFAKDCNRHKYTIGISFGLFILINFLLYSSFLTYYKGVHGILTTLKIWTKTGMKSGHAKPFFYYTKILYKFELPILILGIGGLYFSFRRGNKFTVFVSFWAILIYLIYSYVPYKTPWLILNVLLPIAILAGICINGISTFIKKKWHYGIFYPLYVGMFGFLGYQCILLNYVNFDDERCELVYVQTKRDIYLLLDRMNKLSDAFGKDMTINFVAKEYWPLPWYFRDYQRANFWGKMIDNPNAPVIIADNSNERNLKEKLTGNYRKERYILRPGVWLIAYIQKDFYDSVFGTQESEKQVSLPLEKVSSDDLAEGLTAQVFHNIQCNGEPFSSYVEKKSIGFQYHDAAKKPYRSPFGIKWEGYLSIRQKGIYQFATKSDDGSLVYIDGKLVVDNGDPHAMRYSSGIVSLDEGYHKIDIQYFDIGGGAGMELLWKMPGKEETFIPGELFFRIK